METSKSTLTVAREALKAGQESVPDYRHPKLSAIGDTANHLILGCVIDRGPKPDITEAQATVRQTVLHQPLGALLGDPGYLLKRNFGSALRARSYHSQNREIRLRVLTHDLGILLRPLRHPRSPQVTACSIQSITIPSYR